MCLRLERRCLSNHLLSRSLHLCRCLLWNKYAFPFFPTVKHLHCIFSIGSENEMQEQAASHCVRADSQAAPKGILWPWGFLLNRRAVWNTQNFSCMKSATYVQKKRRLKILKSVKVDKILSGVVFLNFLKISFLGRNHYSTLRLQLHYTTAFKINPLYLFINYVVCLDENTKNDNQCSDEHAWPLGGNKVYTPTHQQSNKTADWANLPMKLLKLKVDIYV